MPARILILDIETQRAIVETFNLWPKFIHIDRVRVPARVLCYAAKWYGAEEKMMFSAAWNEDDHYNVDSVAYEKMMRSVWKLLDEADYVVTWNGDRFDLQWIEEECGRLEMGRPATYKSLDLIKILKRRFKAGLLSMKLDWSARMWLRDQKTPHGGSDLWHDIRYGSAREKAAAKKLMHEYNEHDVELTERIMDRYRPWLPVNLALYRSPEDPDYTLLGCSKCGQSGKMKRNGFVYTNAFAYQRYRCGYCGGESRGKRSKRTTELRPVQ